MNLFVAENCVVKEEASPSWLRAIMGWQAASKLKYMEKSLDLTT